MHPLTNCNSTDYYFKCLQSTLDNVLNDCKNIRWIGNTKKIELSFYFFYIFLIKNDKPKKQKLDRHVTWVSLIGLMRIDIRLMITYIV